MNRRRQRIDGGGDITVTGTVTAAA